jgi:tRNA threonylcarbamoyladenosine biosynthesis protein TsaE
LGTQLPQPSHFSSSICTIFRVTMRALYLRSAISVFDLDQAHRAIIHDCSFPLTISRVTHTTHSVAETQSLAAELARTLKGGQCLALNGELGAGKTQFVRGLVEGLGGDPRTVSSPTFVLLNVYDGGRLAVYHLDAYRVATAEDFENIGFAELLEQGGIVVVEWASRIESLLPPDCIHIDLEFAGKHRRRITVRP